MKEKKCVKKISRNLPNGTYIALYRDNKACMKDVYDADIGKECTQYPGVVGIGRDNRYAVIPVQ